VPTFGPITKTWVSPPLYSNTIDYPLPNYIKVKSPNGGESFAIGAPVDVTFYTAGLQGLDVEVYYHRTSTGVATKITTVTIAAAANEAGEFSKETTVVWDTTGLVAGTDYSIRVVVKDQTASAYFAASDATFELR
jgi:hypothetical protein